MRLPAFLSPSSRSHSSSSQRVSSRSLPTHVLDDDSDDEHSNDASVPLTSSSSIHDSDTSSYPPPSSRHKSSSTSPFSFHSFLSRLPIPKILLVLVILTALYRLHRYTASSTSVYSTLHSHLDSYSEKYNPWHPFPEPTVFVAANQTVVVRGRAYRAAKERKDDRYLGWKGVPYGKAPEGEKRFRKGEWLDEVEEGREKERVMDTWDEGCVRPRGRTDGKDGPKPDFDGHEDCLK
jgi:hypothetical protein